jgi:hypothetical protein
MPTPYPHEQLHRIKYTKLTPEQIAGRLAAVTEGDAAAVQAGYGAKRDGTWTFEHVAFRPD